MTFLLALVPHWKKKITKSKKTFYSYLGKSNDKSIFSKPCTDTEVLTIIKCMNISKACGPNSIPTNLLNEFSESLIGLKSL